MSTVIRADRRVVRATSSAIMVLVLLGVIAESAAGLDDVGHLPFPLAETRHRVTRLVRECAELAGKDDLLDSLHFAWFDRPYSRATLAVLVKTSAVLEREVRLREHQSGAMSDAVVRRMLDWSERAITRVRSSSLMTSFQPHRLIVCASDLTETPPVPSLFGVVDRTTATAHDERFHDLDLLAAAGLRVYARIEREWSMRDARNALADRVSALGIATVIVDRIADTKRQNLESNTTYAPTGQTSENPGATILTPMSLRAMFQTLPGALKSKGQIFATVYSPYGEPWSSMLARHALARGVAETTRFVADGWTVANDITREDTQPSQVSAAMWVAALDGQSLGLIRGWRDLRDGSGSPYPSLFTQPAVMEAMLHTALDMIRLGRFIEPFRTTPPIAIAVSENAVSADDDNEWATWVQSLWKALLDRQIRFDIVPASVATGPAASRYAAVVRVDKEPSNWQELLVRIERTIANSSRLDQHIEIHQRDGTLARDMFVRVGLTPNGKRCIALCNLTDHSRDVRFSGYDGADTLHDVLAEMTNANSGDELHFTPWQVMLLWPRQ